MSSELPETVSVPDTVLWQQVGDEVVLLDLGAGEYHGLNDIASRMWQALEECPDVAAACERLGETYEVEPEVLRDDLIAFIGRLVATGLLTTP